MIFYTNRFIPARFAAYTIGFIILIRPQYKDDEGLAEHEHVHVDQFLCTLGISALLYAVSKKWRLRYEAQAYAAQLEYYPDDRLRLFAHFLSTKYGLGITQDAAEAEIRKYHHA